MRKIKVLNRERINKTRNYTKVQLTPFVRKSQTQSRSIRHLDDSEHDFGEENEKQGEDEEQRKTEE